MFVTIKERLRQLEEVRQKVEDGTFIFDADKINFGFRRMDQLLDVSEDAIKGYPCVAYNRLCDPVKFGVKLIPLENRYPLQDHPCHLEAKVLRAATELVRSGETPHIAYFFDSFNVGNKKKAVVRFPLKALKDEIYSSSDVLVAEYVPGGCVDEWVDEQPNITEKQWKYVIFSVAWTLHVLQDKLRLHHNDFHCGNVLIDTSIDPCDKSYYQYVLDKIDGESLVFNVQSCGVLAKLWDTEFAASYDEQRTFRNNFYKDNEEDIPHEFNPYYDLHCFLMSLLRLPIPSRLMDFICSIYPKEVIPPAPELTTQDSYSDRRESDTDSYYYDDYYTDSEESTNRLNAIHCGEFEGDELVESQEGYDSYPHSDVDEGIPGYLSDSDSSHTNSRKRSNKANDDKAEIAWNRRGTSPCENVHESEYYSRHYRTDESSSEHNSESDIRSEQSYSDTGSGSRTSQTSRIRTEYTLGDRLLNGAEKAFRLPTPFDIITSDYFTEYRKPIPEGLKKDGTPRIPSCVFTYQQRDHSDEKELDNGIADNFIPEKEDSENDDDISVTIALPSESDQDTTDEHVSLEGIADSISELRETVAKPNVASGTGTASGKRKFQRPATPIPRQIRKKKN